MKHLNTKLLSITGATLVFLLVGTWGLHKFQKKRNSAAYLDRADQMRQQGELGEARQLYRMYLANNPKDQARWLTYALISKEWFDDLVKQRGRNNVGQFEKTQVFSITERALQLNATDVKLLDAAADFNAMFGPSNLAIDRYRQLIRLLEEANQEVPLDYRVRLAALIDLHSKDQDAVETLSAWLGYDPGAGEFKGDQQPDTAFVDCYLILANHLMKLRPNGRDGNTVINRMVDQNPTDSQAYLRRAAFAQSHSRNDENKAQIRSDLEKALELAPDDSTVVLAVARSLLQNRELERVRNLLDGLILRDPANVEAYALLSQWAAIRNDIDQAIEFAEKGLEYNPLDLQLLWLRANYAVDKKDFKGLAKIKPTFAKVPTINPLFASAIIDFFSGREQMSNGEWASAVTALKAAESGFQEYRADMVVVVKQNLAACYENLGQNDKRVDVYRQILTADPTNLAATWGCIDSLLAQNQFEQAKAEYQKLVPGSLDPKTIEVPYLMKYLSMEVEIQNQLPKESRSWARTESLVRRVTELDTVPESVKLSVMHQYFKSIGEEEKAQRVYAKIIEKSPNSMPAILEEIRQLAPTDPAKALARLDELSEDNRTDQGEPLALTIMRVNLVSIIGGPELDEKFRKIEADAARLEPNQQSLLFDRMAEHRLFRKNYPEAKRLWQAALPMAQKPHEIQQQLFDMALDIGDEAGMEEARQSLAGTFGEGSPETVYADVARMVWRVANNKSTSPNELETGRSLLRNAIVHRPKWDRAHLLMGSIELQLGEREAAKESLKLALENGPARPKVLRRLAEIYYQEGQYDRCEEMLGRIDESLRTNQDQRLLIELQTRHGSLPKDLVLNRNSKDPAELIWYSQLLFNVGRLDEASEFAQLATAAAPAIPAAWQNYVRVLMAQNKPDEARKAIQNAQLEVAEQDVPRLLGTCYEMVGDYQEAERSYKLYLESQPDDRFAMRSLAALYATLGRVADANEYLNMLLASPDGKPKYDSESTWARRTKARLLAATKNYGDFRQALELIDQNVVEGSVIGTDDLVLWGQLSARREDEFSRAQAITKFEKARMERSLTDAEQLVLAELYHKQGKWSECKGLMQNLLTRNPADLTLLAPWLDWLLAHNELAEAELWLRNCPENSIVTVLTRANLLVRQKRTPDAKKLISQLIPQTTNGQLPPDALPVLLQISKLLESLAEYDTTLYADAEKMLREYLKFRPQDGLELAMFLGKRGEPKQIEEAIGICEKFFKDGQERAALSVVNIIVYSNRSKLPPDSPVLNRIRNWFLEAEKANPESPELMVQRSDFENAIQNYSGVETWLRKYLESPKADARGKASAQNNLAYLLALRGEGDESLKLIEAAIAQSGPLAELRDTRAAVMIARKEYQKAITDIDAAMTDAGETNFRLFRRAIAANLKGEKEVARDSMQKALDMGLVPEMLNKLELPFYVKLMKDLGLSAESLSSNSR